MIKEWILKWARNREPDFVIGGHEQPYLRRHWLLPRNPIFNIYVHQFLRSDDDRALHDHPWLFNASWLIDGAYFEHLPGPREEVRRKGDLVFRWGGAAHRVELFDDLLAAADHLDTLGLTFQPKPCWTVFFTGPVVREWGFLCPKGWVPWREFVDSRDKGSVGKGCA